MSTSCVIILLVCATVQLKDSEMEYCRRHCLFVYSLWNIINGRSPRSVHLGNKTGLCASNLGTSWIHSLLVFCNFEINKYKEYVNFHERDKATFANIS